MNRRSLRVLDNLHIASPCDASWADMKGDERRRFCGQCEKNVYDLTVLSPDEVVDLIEATEGRFCGRLYQRRDGRVLTDDCPVGLARLARRAKRRTLTAAAFAVSLLAGAFSLVRFGQVDSPAVFGPDTKVNRALQTLERHTPPDPDPPILMGEPAAIEPTAPPPVEMGDIAVEPPTDN